MLEKLEAINEKYLEIEKEMNDPAVMQDMKHYVKISKDYKDLQPIIEAYKTYKNVLENIRIRLRRLLVRCVVRHLWRKS